MCGQEFYMGQVAGLWTQTLLFGLYVALFAGSIYILRDKQPNNRFYLTTSIAMFILCSALMLLNLTQFLLTPEFVANSQCIGSLCVSCTLPQTQTRLNETIIQNFFNIILDFVFGLAQIIADGLLIFRCYILWKEKKWIVIAPLVLLLANTACTLGQAGCDIIIYNLRREIPLSQRVPPPYYIQISNLDSAFSIATMPLSLATNLVASALIISRILWMAKKLERTLGVSAGTRYRSAVTMIIESGAMWSISIVVFLITYFTAPNYHGIPGYAMQQLMGIAPTLIIVRVGLGKSIESQPIVSTSNASEFSRSGSMAERSVNSTSALKGENRWTQLSDVSLATPDAESMSRADIQGPPPPPEKWI
ncbi:hypothetical protein EVG20_g1450 [Dentipellis fragilis]|uniref:G-protein coupled receptors family 1 profile domain-containing protein n=1 Tax=Dentipellis fragilis TaxID=205917 RepID=A0A4Y9Z9X2_9AGAM|nr:hypothetical protein EVG20_g1450 [Dentipellis fragilis]